MVKFHHLNVGHGDTTLIELEYNKFMLIDCKCDSNEVYEDVISFINNIIPKPESGKRLLDYLVITHPHEDHLAGIKEISEEFEIGNIWESGFRFDDNEERPHYEDFLALIKEKGSVKLRAGRKPYKIGNVEFYCFASSKYDEEDNNDVHYDCLVLKMMYGNRAVLFAGDSNHEAWKNKIVKYYGERELQDGTKLENLLGSDYLNASHHGSRTFFMDNKDGEPYLEGIESIDPDITIISGLSEEEKANKESDDQEWPPHEDAIEIYKNHSNEVLITGDHGTITYEIESDGKALRKLSESVRIIKGRKNEKVYAPFAYTGKGSKKSPTEATFG